MKYSDICGNVSWIRWFLRNEVDEKITEVIFFSSKKKIYYGLTILCPLMDESERLVQAS